MQTKTDNRVYAGFFVRLAAYLVDLLIVGTALLVVRIPLWISGLASPDNLMIRDFIFKYSIGDITLYILQVVYFILLTYYTGSTLGKKLFQIRVVSSEGRKMTFFEVAFRETVGRFLSALVINVGYIMIGVDKEKRGIHDLLSDTSVIYYHEKKVYTHLPVTYRDMTQSGNSQYVTQPDGNQIHREQKYTMPLSDEQPQQNIPCDRTED